MEEGRIELTDITMACVICGDSIDVVEQSLAHKKNIASYKYSHVMTLGFQENIHTHCQGRQDDWATRIQSRISAVNDLPAEEALYHHTCKNLFLKGKDVPGVEGATYTNKKEKLVAQNLVQSLLLYIMPMNT